MHLLNDLLEIYFATAKRPSTKHFRSLYSKEVKSFKEDVDHRIEAKLTKLREQKG
jgi:hypothetical protein